MKDRNPSAAAEKGSGREKERPMWDACCYERHKHGQKHMAARDMTSQNSCCDILETAGGQQQ